MADNTTLGRPGLLFPFVNHSVETGIIQEDVDSEGGFALWGKKGEPGKVYATKPASDGVLLGVCQRTTVCDGYSEGDAVNVVKKGRVWVNVKGEVLAGQPANIDDNTGLPTSAATAEKATVTAISGGVFKSNAADGALAELEIA